MDARTVSPRNRSAAMPASRPLEKRLLVVLAQGLATASVIVACGLMTGCKLGEKEAEKTKAQLSKLSRDVGAQAAAAAIEGGYKQNVAPLVSATAVELEKSETYREVKETGSAAVDSISATGSAAYDKTKELFADMPQDERELVATVDGWTDSFIAWLGLKRMKGSIRWNSLSSPFGLRGRASGPVAQAGTPGPGSRVRTRLIGGGGRHPGR